MIVIQAISLALLASLLSNLSSGSEARHLQTRLLFVRRKIKVLPKWPLQAFSNLAVIIVSWGTTFKVTFNCILWNFAVLVDFTFCVDAFPQLLNCFLLPVQIGGEDPVDKNALLEISCFLIHLIRRLQVSHSHKFFSFFFDCLLENGSSIRDSHWLGIFLYMNNSVRFVVNLLSALYLQWRC